MSTEHPDPVHWNKVAAELRAARETQRRTWGDIDNATLGRYLADEASSSERAQVETALETLPELKLLTELVRDVLGDSGPAQPVAPVTVQVPAVASIPATLPLRRPAPFGYKPRRGFSRQRATVLAAAGVFLALGALLFRTDSDAPRRPANLKSRGDAVALARSLKPMNVGTRDPEDAEIVFTRLDELQKQIEESETKGDVQTALAAARDFTVVAANVEPENDRRHGPKVAAGWNRVGLLYRNEGDIDGAERALAKANEINRKTLGEHHEATRQTCYYLASVYQDAVNFRGQSGPMMMKMARPAPDDHGVQLVADKVKNPRDESLARFHDRMNRPEMRRQFQESVLPVLKKALEDSPSPAERTRLAIALGNLGDLALDAEPVVMSRLQSARDPNECYALVHALHQMRRTPSDASVRVLAQTLRKCEADAVRRSVANYLGQSPTGREQLNEWAAQGKEAEKQIANEALLRPRGGR